ncbi:increased DNA methylation 1-like protein, partial [Tanacetum coccineum]
LENVDILIKPSREDLGLINVAVALTIMEECFVPMVDTRTDQNTFVSSLNYEGFYTMVLEKDDILLCVASLSDRTGYKELGVEKSGSNPEGEFCNTARMERRAQKQAKSGTKNVGWYENGLLPCQVSVFNFQPQDPESIYAALAGLLGRKLPGMILLVMVL